jgi:hypothetical protein
MTRDNRYFSPHRWPALVPAKDSGLLGLILMALLCGLVISASASAAAMPW